MSRSRVWEAWDAYAHWLIEEASTDHVSTALEAKIIKPAQRDAMQWQGVLPWAWCDSNMITLTFSGLEHGQRWPAFCHVLCHKFPQSKPKHRCIRVWPSS